MARRIHSALSQCSAVGKQYYKMTIANELVPRLVRASRLIALLEFGILTHLFGKLSGEIDTHDRSGIDARVDPVHGHADVFKITV
jgi:hypothetical protein